MLRMTINIEPDERDALIKLARQQHRDFRQQAALLVRQRLEQLGLIQPTPTKNEVTQNERQPA